MTSLHQITKNHMELSTLANNDEDMLDNEEIDKAIADTMQGIEGEFNDKATSLMAVMMNMDEPVDAITKEIARLTARKKSIQSRQSSMKEYLRINMEASNISKIECSLFTITLGKGRDIAQINDANKIPTDYLDIKTTMTPMKKEILSDLKSGVDIPGASMVKSKSSIRIK